MVIILLVTLVSSIAKLNKFVHCTFDQSFEAVGFNFVLIVYIIVVVVVDGDNHNNHNTD